MTTCNLCQTPLTCNSQSQQCWCFELPAVLPPTKEANCLCKSCLIKKINSQLEDWYATLNVETLVEKAAQYQNQMPVRELDYYLNEDGFRVMTKWAHLKRGYCCGNGCQHCPY